MINKEGGEYMGKPIFCILGRSGSGKSTYLDALMNTSFVKDNEIIELKYHTTRSKRSPEEDSYYFTTYEEYKNTSKEDIIESREYQKYDEKVVYYTTKDDVDKDCKAFICAASVDQAISYYSKLGDVYFISIYMDTKERLLRLINRCNTENECYEVCRRTLEEDEEINRFNSAGIPSSKIAFINNNTSGQYTINGNLEIIKNFISSNL